MFEILIILLLSMLCYIIYTYSSRQIAQLKKQVMLLVNLNNKLEDKIKLITSTVLEESEKNREADEVNSVSNNKED